MFFLSDIIICSFDNNELRKAPMSKLFISISCNGQCPVFRNNNPRTPGNFRMFSHCSDEVSK